MIIFFLCSNSLSPQPKSYQIPSKTLLHSKEQSFALSLFSDRKYVCCCGYSRYFFSIQSSWKLVLTLTLGLTESLDFRFCLYTLHMAIRCTPRSCPSLLPSTKNMVPFGDVIWSFYNSSLPLCRWNPVVHSVYIRAIKASTNPVHCLKLVCCKSCCCLTTYRWKMQSS